MLAALGGSGEGAWCPETVASRGDVLELRWSGGGGPVGIPGSEFEGMIVVRQENDRRTTIGQISVAGPLARDRSQMNPSSKPPPPTGQEELEGGDQRGGGGLRGQELRHGVRGRREGRGGDEEEVDEEPRSRVGGGAVPPGRGGVRLGSGTCVLGKDGWVTISVEIGSSKGTSLLNPPP